MGSQGLAIPCQMYHHSIDSEKTVSLQQYQDPLQSNTKQNIGQHVKKHLFNRCVELQKSIACSLMLETITPQSKLTKGTKIKLVS